MNEDQLLKELKRRFGAILESRELEEEELSFLKSRDEAEIVFGWDFDAFVKHYQLIKEYALEEKLLELLAIRIEGFMDPFDIEQLKKTEFFRQFGEEKIIRMAISESNRRNKQ